MTDHKHCTVLGSAEAAARYGIKAKTVQQWWWRSRHDKLRHPMPDPIGTVSGAPAWCAEELDAWRITGW